MSGAYEYGTIYLSRGQFDTIRKSVRSAHNARLAHQYKFALKLHNKLKKSNPENLERKLDSALRGIRPKTAEELREEFGADPRFWDDRKATKKLPFDLDPEGLLHRELTRSKTPTKLYKPRKVSFSVVPVDTRLYKVASPSTTIVFNVAVGETTTYAIRWTAYATESLSINDLRKLPAPQALFKSLKGIKRWSKGYGTINRCDGEYVAETFGKDNSN